MRGDTSGDGTYSLLVGSYGTLWRGYFKTTDGSTKGAITPSNYAGYRIKVCCILQITNSFMVRLEGDSRNDVTSLVLKINGIDYTLGMSSYGNDNTIYDIFLNDNGALFYYLDANINKSVDIKITAP